MKVQIEVLKQNSILWGIYTVAEDYSPTKLDKHQQFVSSFSKNRDIQKPIVSQFLIENGFSVEYPDDKKFAVCLTHDVDEIYPPASHILYSSFFCLKERKFSLLKKFLVGKKGEDSPYWNFKKIINIEKKYDAVSSFYIISTNNDIKRFRYNVEDLYDELKNLIDIGYEVGLHGGYYSFDNFYGIKSEKERLEKVLGKKIIGYRNHYLRLKIPETWQILQDLGFKYDTTLGYNDLIGFRNGMCHPFKPYNLITEKEMDILEIPLIVMDGSLFHVTKNFNAAWAIAKKMIDTVEQMSGIISLNWHNNTFNCPFKRDWETMYEKILGYCYNKNAWLTNGSEITNWWKINSN